MSASTANPLRPISAARKHRPGRREPRVLSMSLDIQANRRQLLYALTLPEYMEAWMTLPEVPCAVRPVVARSGAAVAVQYRGPHGEVLRADGHLQSAAQDKVVFTWWRVSPNRTRETLVTLKLRGSVAGTKLSMNQVGLMTHEEFHWHRKFWDASMSMLHQLFASGRKSAFCESRAPATGM